MLKSWEPTPGKTILAIGTPLLAVAIFFYHFRRLGFEGYVEQFSRVEFLISQIVMVVALIFWIVRYSIPSVKFLSR